MARRRKTRYQWLPNTGTGGPTADPQDTSNGRDFGVLAVAASGVTAISILDLLLDDAQEDVTTGPIGQLITNEYAIRRIVGKIFLNVSQTSGDQLGAILCACGIFVARAEDIDTLAPGVFLPIGASVAGQGVNNYSPLRNETIREPWIWRRTWILSNQASTTAAEITTFPRTNVDYGSVADGPHIDAKTMRRVGNDDRLWAVVAARSYPTGAASTAGTGGNLRAYIDYRVLGAGRRAHNRSAF